MPTDAVAVTAKDDRAVKRAAQRRAKAKNIPYTQALVDVRAIRERMADSDMSYAEAEAWYDDPANELLCDKCGWTMGMVCPECPGCGCYNRVCSGWRHEEFMDDDEREELREDERCEECGADVSLGSYDTCTCG